MTDERDTAREAARAFLNETAFYQLSHEEAIEVVPSLIAQYAESYGLERQQSAYRQAIEIVKDCFPTNWTDPLLTGPTSTLKGDNDCRDIERLLNAVKSQIVQQLQQQGGAE
jgi:hypothetical protein